MGIPPEEAASLLATLRLIYDNPISEVPAEANKYKLSVWWYDLQQTWNEHVARIRDDIDAKRAEHDVDRAQRRAERRADDAAFAVEFAYAAIEEAENSVLDAELARMEADERSAA